MFVTHKVHAHPTTGSPDRLTIRIKPNGSDLAFKQLNRNFLVALIDRKVLGTPWKDVDLGTTFKLKPGDTKVSVALLVDDARTHVRLFNEQRAAPREVPPCV